MSKIQQSIERLLKKHRIILWYDAEQTFATEFDALSFKGTEKVLVDGNEFTTKIRVLHTEPDQSFLLYIPASKPLDKDNWLLDLELAYHVFHTDQESLYLQELGLGYHLRDWIAPHVTFFNNKERLSSFKLLLNTDSEDETSLTYKLLQVLFNVDSCTIGAFLRSYASRFVNKKHGELEKELDRFNLREEFWAEVSKNYGYLNLTPDIYDFLVEAFQKCFSPLQSKSSVNKEAQILVNGWKDTLSFQTDFHQLSQKIQHDLDIEQLLNTVDLSQVIEDDIFELIDRRVVSELSRKLLDGSVDRNELVKVIKIRELRHWFGRYEAFYKALYEGSSLLETVKNTPSFSFDSFEQGFSFYTKDGYRVDQHYRKFLQYYREARQNNVLNGLYVEVNKVYTNSWLLPMNDAWQTVVDRSDQWYLESMSQKNFFKYQVLPYLKKDIRVFVIISDALRYESGQSLLSEFQKEYRFEADLEYQVAMLPSYTQLGMAALLPHKELALDKSANILADGQPTAGLAQRKKVLESIEKYSATAILAENLMNLNSRSQEAKDLVQNHDVVYVYHNRIDKLGDDKTSEEKVIEATAEEIKFLVDLVKKISNANVSNIIVTADHGSIYQHEQIDDSDFSTVDIKGDTDKINRRFVIGKNLVAESNLKHFTAGQVGLVCDYEIMIPKSINRLRVQGSGSRFVHGGASLQEVVIPVLSIKKTREDTIKKVEIDVLNKDSNRITTNIKRITLYQYEAVTDGVMDRTLRIQFKSKDGEELSNAEKLVFGSTSSNARDREHDCKFQLSAKASSEFKNKTIELCLEEQVEGSNRWVQYKKYPYVVNISFTNDFDEF